ncbi:unnamed protein product [Closterium sp. Naga37s-1]|nr:unnamed protein product [Closterium sp. Naga37s-1]
MPAVHPYSRAPDQQQTEGDMSSFRALMRLGRLKFIPYSSMLALMGALSRDISHNHGFRFRIESFVPVALFVACTHVMTHYYNEYFDYEADLTNKHRGKWNGGSGVLPEGLLPRWLALAAANVLLIGSVVTQLAFFRAPAQCVACATLFLSWAYTAPPFKLHYRGLGEATVAAVLTCSVPVMGALQRRDDDAFVLPTSLRAIIPLLCAQQMVCMMIMNLPDIDSDLQCGKITLTARLGPERVARLYRFTQNAVGVMAVILFACGRMTWPVLVAFLVATTKGISLARRLDGIVFAVTRTAAGSSRDTKKYDDATSDHTAVGKPLKSTMDFGDLPYQATIHVASTALMLVLAQTVVLMMQ